MCFQTCLEALVTVSGADQRLHERPVGGICAKELLHPWVRLRQPDELPAKEVSWVADVCYRVYRDRLGRSEPRVRRLVPGVLLFVVDRGEARVGVVVLVFCEVLRFREDLRERVERGGPVSKECK